MKEKQEKNHDSRSLKIGEGEIEKYEEFSMQQRHLLTHNRYLNKIDSPQLFGNCLSDTRYHSYCK